MEETKTEIEAPERRHAEARSIDLARFLHAQREWSEKTFGPGCRSVGIHDHVLLELVEMLGASRPETELVEWIDIALLAFDAAWRLGFSPEEVCGAMLAKAEKNRNRRWPDWRTVGTDRPIEHIRDEEGES